MKKRTLVFLLVFTLAVGSFAGGTVAWLTDTTEPVKNTFTIGNIDIGLSETKSNFKMVPGQPIEKDPVVTVKENSEACWLFMRVEQSANFGSFMTLETADGWSELSGVSGVYYRAVDSAQTEQSFAVLRSNQVVVKQSVTKAQMDGLTAKSYPTLTFTALAIQQSGFDTPSAAWETLSSAS